MASTLARLHEAFQHVKYYMHEAREKNKRIYNQKAEKCNYKVGDAVYYHDKTVVPGTSSKLTSSWKPYYRIVEQTSPVNFIIRHQMTGQSKLVHAEKLHPAHPDSVWDKARTIPKPIINKYHAKVSQDQEITTRDQPLHQAKLLVPEIGNRVLLPAKEQENTPTPLSGVAGSSSPTPVHRYQLRPRSVRRPNDYAVGKRSKMKRRTELTDSTSDNPSKKVRLEQTEEPMEVAFMQAMNLPDWALIVVGACIGMLFMVVSALCMQIMRN